MPDPFCQKHRQCVRPRDHRGPCVNSVGGVLAPITSETQTVDEARDGGDRDA